MRLTNAGSRWLRALLGSLLALHLGLAQAATMATMATMAHMSGEADARRIAHSVATRAASPCHTMAMSAMDADTSAPQATFGHASTPGTQQSPCCGDGLCHCAAASGATACCTSTLIGIVPHGLAPRIAPHAESQAQPALELRPPISR